LGREFGLIGQETVGVGGFAKALRTIPVALSIAQIIREVAPQAFFINFTNPAGLITEALTRHASDLNVIGLCNVPWNVRAEIGNVLHIENNRIELDYVGLNHLSWVRGARYEGSDISTKAIEGFRGLTGKHGADQAEPAWEPETIDILQSIPNYYLLYYYETREWIDYQKSHPTRASRVAEIEEELLKKYSDPHLDHKPEELMQRGGAYYSDSAAELMADICSDAGTIHIVNTRNNGAVPGMPDDVVMEIPARITKSGAQSIPTHAMRLDMDSLIRSVKDFELQTIEAAVTGDEDLALRALITNPLGPDYSQVNKVWNRLKEVHSGLLGKFDV
jgi:6-phospho-beta-glucosidase